MGRVVDAEVPTRPIPVMRPSRPSTPERPSAAVQPDESVAGADPTHDSVSRTRRSAGRGIAIALLITFVVGVVWFVVHQVLTHMATPNPAAPGR
jgi:hypothetical protein